MTPREKAEELFWKYTKVSNFSAILDFDGNTHIDLEFGISKVKECALIAVENEYNSLRELLFNLRSCKVIESDLVYLKRIDALIQEEQEVKNDIIYLVSELFPL